MSTLSASFFISLDGVVEAPETWHFPYFNDEMAAAVQRSIASSHAFLLGRRTYEEWAAYWPQQDSAQSPLAAALNAMPKFVASRSLAHTDWQNSTVLEGDAVEAVRDLKRREDGAISISGSTSLVRSLLDADLVDELRLMVHPVVVGRGARLFGDGVTGRPLQLVESQTFATGVLNLTYRAAA